MKFPTRRVFLQILLFPIFPALCKGDSDVPETAQEKALAEVAAAQYREYRRTGVPLENAMIERTNMEAPDYANVEGQTNADIQAVGDNLKNQRIATTTKTGADASSGAVVMGVSKDAIRLSEAGGAAGAKAGQSVEDRGFAAKQQMIAIGRGQATDAINSMREQAATSARTALEDRALEVESDNGTAAAIGTGIGMATAASTKKKPATAGGV